EELPESMLVVGGGPVGLELGQAFARFGSRIAVADVVDRIAIRADDNASAALTDALRAEGIELLLGATIARVARDGDGIVATIDGSERRFEKLLLAAGRLPNVEPLGLDAIGV